MRARATGPEGGRESQRDTERHRETQRDTERARDLAKQTVAAAAANQGMHRGKSMMCQKQSWVGARAGRAGHPGTGETESERVSERESEREGGRDRETERQRERPERH